MQIYVSPELEQRLRQESKDTGYPMSQILASALNSHLGSSVRQAIGSSSVPRTVEVGNTISLPTMQMACCKLPNPCRHWKFNELESNYTNTLTGEIREVV